MDFTTLNTPRNSTIELHPHPRHALLISSHSEPPLRAHSPQKSLQPENDLKTYPGTSSPTTHPQKFRAHLQNPGLTSKTHNANHYTYTGEKNPFLNFRNVVVQCSQSPIDRTHRRLQCPTASQKRCARRETGRASHLQAQFSPRNEVQASWFHDAALHVAN
jgi:hypothetical protein